MKRIISFSVIALSLIGGIAQAAPIFSYTVSANPASFPGLATGNSISLAGGSGSGKDGGFPGGTNINVLTANIAAGSSTINSVNQAVGFSLTLTDTGSGKSGTSNFSGTWVGSLGNNNSSMTLMSFLPSSPQTLALDGFLYTITYTTPNFNSVGANTFSVNVSATALPEPSSIVVIAIAMVGGLFGTRRFLRSR